MRRRKAKRCAGNQAASQIDSVTFMVLDFSEAEDENNWLVNEPWRDHGQTRE